MHKIILLSVSFAIASLGLTGSVFAKGGSGGGGGGCATCSNCSGSCTYQQGKTTKQGTKRCSCGQCTCS